MRILLLSNLYPPHVLGGAEIVARDFAVGLADLGHEVTILTSTYGVAKPQQESRIRRTLQYTFPAHFDRRRPVFQQLNLIRDYYRYFHDAANVKELRRVITEVQPDVIYVWEITGIGVNTMLAALGTVTMPVVFHLESYWWQYARSPQTEQTRLRTRRLKQVLIGTVPNLPYTSLIAASQAVKQEYAAAGCDPQRIEVIYNCIDARFVNIPRAACTDEDSNEPQVHLTFVGRLCVEKGVLVILKALAILINQQSRRHLHLNIFGDGDDGYMKELHAFIRENQLAAFVTFHGKVLQDVLIAQYDRSDIMLIPSLWKEPFGLVVAEAMARGLPIITSNIGGPAEIITHEVDGLLIEPGDEHLLATAITRLLDNPDECQRFAQAARATVQERFMVGENARRVEQHLRRVIASRTVQSDAPVLSGS
jgi:glycogen synthase